MNRRKFIAGLSGSVAWPVVARAQKAIPVIGFLHVGSTDVFVSETTAFQNGLSQTGYIEGKNVFIEHRWAEGRRERLIPMALDLVNRKVTLIAATPSSAATAAKAATNTIPIVFVSSFDPVSLGLVSSLAKPSGNITGITTLSGDLEAKQLELLREVLPKPGAVGLLVDPTNLNAEGDTKKLQAIANGIGQPLVLLQASSEQEIEASFKTLKQEGVVGLLVGTAVLFARQRQQIVSLATRNGLPTVYARRDYAISGGLMSYGADLIDASRLAGIYAGRILKGEKPADLPVQQSMKFDFVINLKTAKALGIAVPLPLLGRADEVIE